MIRTFWLKLIKKKEIESIKWQGNYISKGNDKNEIETLNLKICPLRKTLNRLEGRLEWFTKLEDKVIKHELEHVIEKNNRNIKNIFKN